MIRGHWKWDRETKKLVPLNHSKEVAPRVYIQTDEIPPTESMATTERAMFTSRKKLEEYDKMHGYRHTGGDHLGQKPPPPINRDQQEREVRADMEDMANKIRWGDIKFTEEEKEQCKREETQYKDWKSQRGLK